MLRNCAIERAGDHLGRPQVWRHLGGHQVHSLSFFFVAQSNQPVARSTSNGINSSIPASRGVCSTQRVSL